MYNARILHLSLSLSSHTEMKSEKERNQIIQAKRDEESEGRSKREAKSDMPRRYPKWQQRFAAEKQLSKRPTEQRVYKSRVGERQVGDEAAVIKTEYEEY